MHHAIGLALFGALGLLAGCGESPGTAAPGPRDAGRYAGIGVFDAGRLWGQMTGAAAPDDPAAAGIADDEHIIVVVDTHSGEIRQCGDLSGYCVRMNPWARTAAAPMLPAPLRKHAAELDADLKVERAQAVAGAAPRAK